MIRIKSNTTHTTERSNSWTGNSALRYKTVPFTNWKFLLALGTLETRLKSSL